MWSNLSVDFDDPKELNIPQLFNDPIKFQL